MKITKQHMFVASVALIGGYLLYSKAKDAAQAVNPMSDQNLAYQGTKGLVDEIGGEGAFNTVADHIFGGLDLINPWAPEYRKNYAKKVYGLE
ncbi:hypothetical protein [Agarivorans sp. QJM3NY_25]|uniref:hypothetical protein n=1 Tax=Agarivorans sp. QJM3NY_25 TaxID=3421430 RepID=UPI003D7DCCFD